MDLKIIYEDDNILVIDKPAGIVVFAESENDGEQSRTIIQLLLELYPNLKEAGEAPRYGIVHRLDKDTSGVLMVAKNTETLIFLQKQFSAAAKALADKKNRETLENIIEKKYIALVCGNIKDGYGKIETLIGRSPKDPKKQKAYALHEKKTGLRQAITEYKILQQFEKYTLLEVSPKTGRKHQIRCHLAYIHHPIAGDKLYGFKDSPTPPGLSRQFLHASYLKIKLPSGQIKEFESPLPEELENVLKNVNQESKNEY